MDKSLILRRIKEYYGFKTDADFSRFLGITPQNLTQWYSRKTFDIYILATKCSEISTDWMATGEGEMVKSIANFSSNVNNNQDIISIPIDVWSVIKNQAESLKEKDKQTFEVIQMLKDQMKKNCRAEIECHVASMVVEDE